MATIIIAVFFAVVIEAIQNVNWTVSFISRENDY